MERRRALPKDVTLAPNSPDRKAELYSAEVDLKDLGSLLKQVAAELRVSIPASLRRAAFLSSLDTDRWVVANIRSQTGDVLQLWYRMEDLDAVEVVVTKEAGTSSVPH